MRVLVTGGSGFLGGYVIRKLVSAGHDALAMARSDAAVDLVRAAGATSVRGDLDEPASTRQAFASADADALLNLASLGFGHAPTIVGAAEEAGLRRAVFVSTTAIFTNLNAASKSVRVAAEDTIRACTLDWTIVRPTMIYGDPGDRNIARLLKLLKVVPVLPLPGDGARLQQPVHVEDLADVLVAALEAPASIRSAYNVAGPEPLTFRALVEQCATAVGRRPRIVPVPMSSIVAAVRLHERMARHPRIKVEQLERLEEDKAFDIQPAVRDLGYRPRAFADGVRQEATLLP